MIIVVAFMAGTVAIALCLLMFGWPLARLSRNLLEGPIGLAIALAGAISLSISLAWLFGDSELMNAITLGVLLSFALPAAILYRREILLERTFE